jgi:hypothetical protein
MEVNGVDLSPFSTRQDVLQAFQEVDGPALLTTTHNIGLIEEMTARSVQPCMRHVTLTKQVGLDFLRV